jgi:hypothetical protein
VIVETEEIMTEEMTGEIAGIEATEETGEIKEIKN